MIISDCASSLFMQNGKIFQGNNLNGMSYTLNYNSSVCTLTSVHGNQTTVDYWYLIDLRLQTTEKC